MSEKQLVSDKDLEPLFNFKTQTWRNWRHKGMGPPYLKIGRAVRYDLKEVAAFLEKHKVTPGDING